MLYDDYLCLVESGKQHIKKVKRKFNRNTWKQRQLFKRVWIWPCIAPPSLSRDRTKMKKSKSIEAANKAEEMLNVATQAIH